MDRFQDGHHVWLRSRVHGTYLNANSDGKSVSLRGRRASLKAAWTVHIYHGEGDAVYLLLHSAAYGRYLAATARRAPLGLGHNGFRAEQRDYDEPEVQAIMWQAVGAGGSGDDVMLRNVDGRYLRANGRYLRWNAGVSVEDMDRVSTMMYWTVEPIPARESGMHDLPVMPNPFLYVLLSQGISRRQIVFVRADAEGLYDEHGWHMFRFLGRSVNYLRSELVGRIAFIDGQDPGGIAMCVRAGRYGRLTPLVVDLPRYAGHDEAHRIVVMMAGTPAYDELRYPDVNAI
ncbi:uncharacterized protein LOC123407221 [Hordeum vulgare subsp. vulgare]|uniref:DUF569 domain-containing protein n=1 Tax=Hordeum vulgare subsp. vulgare TaxID=112509 RepID=A0A8I7BDC6_HORVV|nr:uncharacterized protein LOC123407221 [Hordeum vulgare subsp. vulgare]